MALSASRKALGLFMGNGSSAMNFAIQGKGLRVKSSQCSILNFFDPKSGSQTSHAQSTGMKGSDHVHPGSQTLHFEESFDPEEQFDKYLRERNYLCPGSQTSHLEVSNDREEQLDKYRKERNLNRWNIYYIDNTDMSPHYLPFEGDSSEEFKEYLKERKLARRLYIDSMPLDAAADTPTIVYA